VNKVVYILHSALGTSM